MQDDTTMTESASVAVQTAPHDVVVWRAEWQVQKFNHAADQLADLGFAPDDISTISGEEQISILRDAGIGADETIDRVGNLLMYGGASCLWQCLIGNGTASAGQALTYFNNAQAAIGVGDSSTAAAATQTDLVAATNKLKKAMDSTYPQHTDAATSGAASIIFRSTFATGDANWAWQEWVVGNSTTAATGRILNRKVESLGTKTSAASWQFTVTLTLA